MVSRADRTTSTDKKLEYFSDFSINLDANPFTGALARATNEQAVVRAVKNMIMTSVGERKYDSLHIGSSVEDTVFDLPGQFAQEDVERSVRNTLQFDRRAELLSLTIHDQTSDGGYFVVLVLKVLNLPDPIELKLIIRRSR